MDREYKKTIDLAYMFHQSNADQLLKLELMRKTLKEVAMTINNLLTDSREKALALTKLEECKMWVNTSISVNEKGPDS